MKCNACRGEGIERTSYNICPVCKGRGILPDDRIDQPICAACRGEGIERNSYRFCTVCGGWGRLPPEPENESGPQALFIEAGKPRSAHIKLVSLFKALSGHLRVADPYYGVGSLFRLDDLTHCSPINFLTKTADKKEQAILPKALAEFRKEHPAVSFREDQTGTLHDRYIISEKELILLGHGLKDLGNKDSFVIRIHRDLSADLLDTVCTAFDSKWHLAKDIV